MNKFKGSTWAIYVCHEPAIDNVIDMYIASVRYVVVILLCVVLVLMLLVSVVVSSMVQCYGYY